MSCSDAFAPALFMVTSGMTDSDAGGMSLEEGDSRDRVLDLGYAVTGVEHRGLDARFLRKPVGLGSPPIASARSLVRKPTGLAHDGRALTGSSPQRSYDK